MKKFKGKKLIKCDVNGLFFEKLAGTKKMFVRPRNEFAVKTSRTMKKATSTFTKTTKTEISRDKLGHLNSG